MVGCSEAVHDKALVSVKFGQVTGPHLVATKVVGLAFGGKYFPGARLRQAPEELTLRAENRKSQNKVALSDLECSVSNIVRWGLSVRIE